MPTLLVSALTLLVLAIASAPIEAQDHYQTTLRLQEPVPNVAGVNIVVFRWSTFETFGTVEETDLFNWTVILQVDESRIYTDHVVVGGAVQLFEGQVRESETDYFWRFNFDTGELEQMLNVSSELAMNTTGEHYVVNDSVSIQDDGIVDVSQFLDGAIQDGQSNFLEVQLTEPMLFFDGFESGDTLLWSTATP